MNFQHASSEYLQKQVLKCDWVLKRARSKHIRSRWSVRRIELVKELEKRGEK